MSPDRPLRRRLPDLLRLRRQRAKLKSGIQNSVESAQFSLADRIAALPALTDQTLPLYEELARPYLTPPRAGTTVHETLGGADVKTQIPFSPPEAQKILAGREAIETILEYSGDSSAEREFLGTSRFFPSTREGTAVPLQNRRFAVLSIMSTSNVATRALREWRPKNETLEAFLTLRHLPNYLTDHSLSQTT